jgi:hypothetical protein
VQRIDSKSTEHSFSSKTDDDLKDVDVIGTQIEEVIFKLTPGEKTQCYQRKVASQIFNFGDNRNLALRYKALTG